MQFNIDKDLSIFNTLYKKRPEISIEKLKKDLIRYYLPYLEKLINLKKKNGSENGFLVGVSAVQGAGKTTQGEILEILLNHFGYSCVSLSIDDHYITHQQLCDLRQKDPRFIRRGVTHDTSLAINDLICLQEMSDNSPIIVSGYDKGAHYGDGDRFRWINPIVGLEMTVMVKDQDIMVNKQSTQGLGMHLEEVSFNNTSIPILENMGSTIPIVAPLLPQKLIDFLSSHKDQKIVIFSESEDIVCFKGFSEVKVARKDLPNGWRIVNKKPDFIFYDGWMMGARMVEDESVFSSGLPALETKEDQEFAKDVNKKLLEYIQLWQMFQFLTVLYVPNYQMSLTWRDQAEEKLRAKGAGMNHDQIREFVYYFWRSVHPAIHIKNLAMDTEHTNQVAIINDDHSIGDILTPQQVKSLKENNL